MVDLSQRLANLSPAKRALLERQLLKKEAAHAHQPAIPRRPMESACPLSFAQQRLWFLSQLESDSPLYNTYQAVHIQGALRLPALQESLDALVARHEVLRTTFVSQEGSLTQVPAVNARVELSLIDLRELPEDERPAQVFHLLQEAAQQPFDLTRDLMLRGTLLQLVETDHVLLLTVHHIATDGWSMGILVRELATLYHAFVSGKPALLPELPLQYADYAVWQRQWLQGEVLSSQLAYWQRQLANAPTFLELPADRPRPPVQSANGATHLLELPRDLTGALKDLSRREGSTLFMTVLAAFQTLLYRYSGQEDLLVGTPVANRNRTEIEGLIGFFVNTLVLRCNLAGRPTFRELLHRTREVALEAYAHQDLPFEKLVEELRPERSLSHTPLFQVMFALQNAPPDALELPGLTLTPMALENRIAKFDLTLSLVEESGRLRGRLEYNTDLFDAATIARMAGHLQTLLEGIVADPEQRVSDLPLLTQGERQELLVRWNETSAPYPAEHCIHQLFEAQVERTPNAIAVVWGKQQLTYQELNRRANQLAHHLRQLGVGPEVLVGLCLERSVEMVVAILGILKAGGAYVPLDPAYPKERLTFILEDSQAPLVITQERLGKTLAVAGAKCLCLDSVQQVLAQESAQNPLHGTRPANLAYVIYTSGSTGQPKGVLIPHQALVNHGCAVAQCYGIQASDRVLQFASLSFDVAAEELFPSWLGGATVVLRPEQLPAAGPELHRLIDREQLTVLNLPASYWHEWVRELDRGGESVPASVRLVVVGSEPVSAKCYEQWRQRVGSRVRLCNAYGPTEATITATIDEPAADAVVPPVGSLPIGRPIANTRAYILDRHGHPVPIGVPGELCLGGLGLARGYLQRPELTQEKFPPDPFAPEPGQRMYRTGDRARYRPDGIIELLGRVDRQVKLRGFRIELGEIETALARHPAIGAAAVRVCEENSDRPYLAAYFVLRQGETLPLPELRSFLHTTLPDYMVPPALVLRDALPRLPNGKVDYRALPDVDATCVEQEEAWMAPRTPVEELLAGIWAEVLRCPRVSITANFFHLGGHSLLATQVMSRIRDVLQVQLPLRSLFEAPTVAGLAQLVEQARQAGPSLSLPALQPSPRASVLPLSFAQERLWFLEQLGSSAATYHVPTAFRLRGALDAQALERSLQEIVRRHEALRTTFQTREGRPVQVIASELAVALDRVDLRGHAAGTREGDALRLAQTEATRPFDLTTGPLVRFTLMCLDHEEHLFLVTQHHLVTDGWSLGVFCRELSVLYDAFARGAPSPLPELSIHYADFVHWQRQWLQGDVHQALLDYWKNQLADSPAVLELPLDRPRPRVQTFRGARPPMELPPPLVEALHALSRQEGVTLFMTLLAAYQTLLHRYTGQDDILVGSPVAGRTQAQTEGLLGFFVNTLVLRTCCGGNPTFRELLQRVREVALGAYDHQELPFAKLVEELRPDRNPSYTPFVQTMFALQNVPTTVPELPGLRMSPMDSGFTPAYFDLSLLLVEENGGIRGWLPYNTDLFDASTIQRLIDHYRILLEAIVANPDGRLSELSLLPRTEQQLLLAWNATHTDYPRGQCIQELFETQVTKAPDAQAVVFGGQYLTYDALNRRANQLAHQLRALGVGPEVLVGICVERSSDLIVGLLAILKAGGAYVPLDPSYPRERLALLVADAQMPVVLTHRSLRDRLPVATAQMLCLDSDWPTIAQRPETNLTHATTPDNLAYVIYTSGSSGRPKGVAVPHRGVVRLVCQTDYVQLGPDEVVAQASNASFDAATFEIWGALLHGARLVGIARDVVLSPQDFAAALVQHQISVLMVPTALFNHVARAVPGAFQPVGQVLFGGEAADPRCVRDVLEHGPPARLLNVYGPTENTTASTWHLVREVAAEATTIPIGRPVANTRVYVLDGHLQPVPIGVPGELYLAGDGLARGYWNQPKLTSERFVAAPWADGAGERLYRTGDRVRYRADGALEFLGRLDQQVKLRGFRIELEEIEAALGRHPEVQVGVVLIREDRPGDKRLVAYVVPRSGRVPTPASLRSLLEQTLPDYMIPAAFVLLEALPLTANGKVHRRALPPPPTVPDGEASRSVVAPRDPVERQLTQIWEEVLEVRPVGVQDDFFALGGHSLLAARLFAQIHQVFGRSLPLATLLQGATIEKLAQLLRQADSPSPAPALVALQPHGTRPLFFCVHGIGGELLCYAELARHCAPEQPFYGLQARREEKDGERFASIQAMAAHYLQEIRRVQPQGPYHLGGFSSGGTIAFEMAQQLVANGEQVALLAILDHAPRRSAQRERPWWLRSLCYFGQNLFYLLLDDWLRSRPAELWARLRRKLQAWRAPAPGPENVFDVASLPPWFVTFLEEQYRVLVEYVPQVYPGRITLFRTRTQPVFRVLPSDLGWGDLAEGGVEIRLVPGHHDNMLKEPYVRVLAEELKACLRKTSHAPSTRVRDSKVRKLLSTRKGAPIPG